MPESNPLISIITPIYNRASTVNRTIESVINQTFKNWELLLVDDGSTDNIEEVMAARYGSESRIRLLCRDRDPKGASTCRNIGAEHAKGQYLLFLDSDDLLEPFCLQQRVKAINKAPKIDFAIFKFKYLAANGGFRESNFHNGKDPLINFLSNSSYWNVMSPLWRKKFFISIGGFNANFSRYQDIELNIRALNRPDVRYRMHMELPPDTIVVPNLKTNSKDFPMNIFKSLMILIPQTNECLREVGKVKLLRYMEGYLKEWIKFFIQSNFNELLIDKGRELIDLFYRYGAISKLKLHFYSNFIAMALNIMKTIRFICIKILNLA